MLKKVSRAGRTISQEWRAKFLLISIVLFFVLPPLIENREAGRLFLLLNLYGTLVAATMELAEKRVIFWSALPIAAVSMVFLAVSHYYPTRSLLIGNGVALTAFLGLASISLFVYLGEAGQVATDRIYISVSLYFLLGLTWYSIFNLLNVVEPGSLAEGGTPIPGNAPLSTMLYFSLVTLTTLGYGDIVPVTPPARMLATLEAVSGVLYVAITVARLVGNQGTKAGP